MVMSRLMTCGVCIINVRRFSSTRLASRRAAPTQAAPIRPLGRPKGGLLCNYSDRLGGRQAAQIVQIICVHLVANYYYYCRAGGGRRPLRDLWRSATGRPPKITQRN